MKSGNEKVFRSEKYLIDGYEIEYYPDDIGLQIKQHTAPNDKRYVFLDKKGLLFLRDVFRELKI